MSVVFLGILVVSELLSLGILTSVYRLLQMYYCFHYPELFIPPYGNKKRKEEVGALPHVTSPTYYMRFLLYSDNQMAWQSSLWENVEHGYKTPCNKSA